MAGANRDIRAAAAASAEAARRRAGARRGVAAIDEVLGAVEEHHLARLPRQVRLLREWRDHLEQRGGLTVPRHILTLENTARLHEALLDWQEELLDQLVPGRASLWGAEVEPAMPARVA
jgi:hypothetical protein